MLYDSRPAEVTANVAASRTRNVRQRVRVPYVLTLGVALSACGFLPLTRTSRHGAEPLEAAPKPASLDSSFDGCGADGAQPDYALNRRKNRVDDGTYLAVPWSVVARLPWPHTVAYRFRNQWTSGETREVARYEGAAVTVEGYLSGYRLEVPEPPNCYRAEASARDFHLWLADKPHRRERQSIVVEVTPRVRALHSAWTEEQIKALVGQQLRVRISGWLLLDQMHPELIDVMRNTLWEIHPIMHIQWQRADGGWVSLDSVTIRPDSID